MNGSYSSASSCGRRRI